MQSWALLFGARSPRAVPVKITEANGALGASLMRYDNRSTTRDEYKQDGLS
jgi:hypothetical protein